MKEEEKRMSIQEGNISISEFSKRINLPRNEVIEYMIRNKYIYRQYYGKEKERFKNIAFPKYDTKHGKGLFEMNERKSMYNEGKNNVNIQITPKGQNYFIELFKKEGMIK